MYREYERMKFVSLKGQILILYPCNLERRLRHVLQENVWKKQQSLSGEPTAPSDLILSGSSIRYCPYSILHIMDLIAVCMQL